MASTMAQVDRWTRGCVALLAALALIAVGTQPATAQDGDYGQISVDPRAGVGFPVGDLAMTHQAGFSGGLGVAYKFHPNIGIRGDFDLAVLDDESPQFGVVLAPTLTMVHFNGGVEFDFPRPDWQNFPLSFRWNIGAGGTSMSASRDFPDEVDVDFSGTYPSVNSGVKVGYAITPDVDLFVGGQMYLTFADEVEMAELLKRTGIEPFGTVWSAPVTLGVKASFQ